MIALRNVAKKYPGGPFVLRDIDLNIRYGEKIGVLGRNGSGKSTLIRLLGGSELPTSGKITREMTVSWPLAFTGGFQGSLTGMDNLRFICRVYGVDIDAKIDFVQDFSELGKALSKPLRTYSSGMRARLAFALSMAVDFDCFLIDEVIAVGDSRFHERCRVELFERRADRALVIVSHDAEIIRKHCGRASVLSSGKLSNFETVDAAYDYYMAVG